MGVLAGRQSMSCDARRSFSHYDHGRHGERVQFDIVAAIFLHLQKLSMSYYETKLGRIISRCTSDVGSLRSDVWGMTPSFSTL